MRDGDVDVIAENSTSRLEKLKASASGGRQSFTLEKARMVDIPFKARQRHTARTVNAGCGAICCRLWVCASGTVQREILPSRQGNIKAMRCSLPHPQAVLTC
jgi:hypothetical protein